MTQILITRHVEQGRKLPILFQNMNWQINPHKANDKLQKKLGYLDPRYSIGLIGKTLLILILISKTFLSLRLGQHFYTDWFWGHTLQ